MLTRNKWIQAIVTMALLMLALACTPVPEDHEPAGVYPTFVDLDATSGSVTPPNPNLDAEDTGENDAGAATTDAGGNCPSICAIQPNAPGCAGCP